MLMEGCVSVLEKVFLIGIVIIMVLSCGGLSIRKTTTEPEVIEPEYGPIDVDELMLLGEDDVLVDMTAGKTDAEVVSILMESEAGSTPNVVTEVYDELLKVPSSNIRDLINERWHVVVCNESLQKRFGDLPYPYGMTDVALQTCFIGNSSVDAKEAILYEIGHAIDYINGEISNSDEFRLIFDQEYSNFEKYSRYTYDIQNCNDFFAAVYQNMILYPNDSYCAPQAYDFVSTYMFD